MTEPTASLPVRLVRGAVTLAAVLERIPQSLIALLGRVSIAAVFWNSGQTKVEGFAVDLVAGTYQLGWPRLADSAVALFQEEYRLPLVSPAPAAYAAAFAEHLFPILLLIGLGTRLSALALLVMTAVIHCWSIQTPGRSMAPGRRSCSTWPRPDPAASPWTTGSK